MTLKEALEDVIAHPLKRAMRTPYGLLYYDPSYGEDCLRRKPLSTLDQKLQALANSEWMAAGFGMPLFSITDVVYSGHVVVDIDFEAFERT